MSDRGLTEEEALRVLHKASHVSVVPLVIGWALAGMVLVAVRVWLREAPIGEAVAFGFGIAGLALAVQLFSEHRKASRLRHTRDWTRLERGTVVDREGRSVTIRGKGGRSVTAQLSYGWSLDPDTPVWVGPRIAPGPSIVLVRDSSAAWASPVHVGTAEAG